MWTGSHLVSLYTIGDTSKQCNIKCTRRCCWCCVRVCVWADLSVHWHPIRNQQVFFMPRSFHVIPIITFRLWTIRISVWLFCFLSRVIKLIGRQLRIQFGELMIYCIRIYYERIDWCFYIESVVCSNEIFYWSKLIVDHYKCAQQGFPRWNLDQIIPMIDKKYCVIEICINNNSHVFFLY